MNEGPPVPRVRREDRALVAGPEQRSAGRQTPLLSPAGSAARLTGHQRAGRTCAPRAVDGAHAATALFASLLKFLLWWRSFRTLW